MLYKSIWNLFSLYFYQKSTNNFTEFSLESIVQMFQNALKSKKTFGAELSTYFQGSFNQLLASLNNKASTNWDTKHETKSELMTATALFCISGHHWVILETHRPETFHSFLKKCYGFLEGTSIGASCYLQSSLICCQTSGFLVEYHLK